MQKDQCHVSAPEHFGLVLHVVDKYLYGRISNYKLLYQFAHGGQVCVSPVYIARGLFDLSLDHRFDTAKTTRDGETKPNARHRPRATEEIANDHKKWEKI